MKRLFAIAIAIGLLFAVPTTTKSQGVPITGLPVNPAPTGFDIFPMVHAGATMQSAIASYNTVFVDLISAQLVGGNKTFSGNITFTGSISGLPATPTPAPTPTCATNLCSFTGVVLTIATPLPTPTPVPQPTSANSNASFSGFVLTVNPKAAYSFSWSVSGALTVTTFPWVPLFYNDPSMMGVADQVLCSTPGSSGTNTVKWQYTTATDPYTGSPTIVDVTNSSMSWTTAGGTAANVISPAFNLSAVNALYVRPNVTAVGAGPPSNCTFLLHITH